ncbi:MAG: phosphate regulon sensor histidine kinase PhoR [Rhodoferax sp.]|nr:phosphate regulon sensor histidine kinase PhoR [Rhodoferax sp.]
MLGRLFSFALFQGWGAVFGWWFSRNFVSPSAPTLVPMVLSALFASYLWLLLDVALGMRVLRWLSSGDTLQTPVAFGLWGEISDRVRRLARSRERAVQQRDDRFQDFLAAMQASPNGVVLLDADLRIEWCNQSAQSHFGLDGTRDLLQHFGNLVRDPGFAAYLATGDFKGDVLMPGRASTSAKPVRLSVHMHPYGESRTLLLSRDVTAVEQAEAMRRDFVANVSHEIRTPLTVLSGFVETLQSLNLNEEERARYLQLMALQAERMQSLVSDLLTLSRLEGSPLPSAQEWVSMEPIFEQCRHEASELSRVLWGQPQGLEFHIAPDITVAGSVVELHSALLNLIGNAVRYTPEGKNIYVRWQAQADGGAEFTVRDEGVGIAAEQIPRLTERFYRVDRSRSRETGGTGLGLAIVKHVTQRHGAELSISSLPGQGSTFTIRFPASRVCLPKPSGLANLTDAA